MRLPAFSQFEGVTHLSLSQRRSSSILHADMDSFFVSVELRDTPEMRGVPSAVAYDTPRSVITSASYEARVFGVRSAMPVSQAKLKCPQLVLLEPHYDKYVAASREVMQVLETFTPLVEPISIDEAFLDVAGSIRLFGEPIQIAHLLRTKVRNELGLPVSVGLATSKHVAKLASQRAKPDGVFEVADADTLTFLHDLPVESIWGVGSHTARLLHARAIHSVRDLAFEPLENLTRLVGQANAQRLHELANGEDPREVKIHRTRKSIGHEETFATDVTDGSVLVRELLRLSAKVAERLRSQRLRARTISVKVRCADFETLNRSRTLISPTHATQALYQVARELLDELANSSPKCFAQGIRLIGVRAEKLHYDDMDSLALFEDDERFRALDDAVDEARQKFGEAGLRPARLLTQREDIVDPRSLGDVDGV